MAGLQRPGDPETRNAAHARRDGGRDAYAARQRKLAQWLFCLDRSDSGFTTLEVAGSDPLSLAFHEAWTNFLSMAGKATLHLIWRASSVRCEWCMSAAQISVRSPSLSKGQPVFRLLFVCANTSGALPYSRASDMVLRATQTPQQAS